MSTKTWTILEAFLKWPERSKIDRKEKQEGEERGREKRTGIPNVFIPFKPFNLN